MMFYLKINQVLTAQQLEKNNMAKKTNRFSYSKSWYKKNAELEGGLEVGAGFPPKRLFLPNCDVCKNPQTELGAILYSPPDKNNMCKKIHVCVKCYNLLLKLLGEQL